MEVKEANTTLLLLFTFTFTFTFTAETRSRISFETAKAEGKTVILHLTPD